MKTLSLLGISFLFSFGLYAQRGKNGTYTASALNTVVNAYTALSSNATAGQTSITVTSNTLTSPVLTSALAPGDLILIIQMQGASMNIDPTPATPVAQGGWGGEYTTVIGHVDWYNYLDVWGDVINYNQAGKYEYAQVASISGGNTIHLSCGLTNGYAISGKVQVVRVPRFVDLTVNTGASIVPTAWDGTTGGVLALEVNGNLTISTGAKIDASGKGFRGGQQSDNVSTSAGSGSVNDIPYCATFMSNLASAKGEGIGGFTTEYAALYSQYGVSAPANGGGGAHHHNAGGGGGSNVGSGTYSGKGVPNPTYNTMWALETPSISGVNSSGGGRGGYSYSTSNQNEAILGPNQLSWAGDYRRNNGGRGGHPLTLDATRAFMGGGGGAGDRDNNTNPLNQDGSGGTGGGIVFVQCFGNMTGAPNALIEANGGNGISVNSANATATVANKLGNDGAGGGGGGGAVIISNANPVPNTIIINSKGGNGGNQNLSLGPFATVNEADGPGGGGAGGQISTTSSNATNIVIGGSNGVTNSTQVNAFPPNGATSGASGIANTGVNFYDLTANNDTICGSGSAALSVTLTGTLPAGSTIYWYTDPFAAIAPVANGLTYNPASISTTTTYYVGICPGGDFRIPVQAVIGPNPVIAGTAIVSDVTCAGNDGSITGLTVSSGTPSYTYSWNGTTTASADLNNAIAENYTLTVTDAIGCTATSGPHTINSAGGPVIDASNVVVTNATCAGNDGSITGITQTGGVNISWSNSGGTNLDATNLPAGTYTLTVTDASNCAATAGPYTITAPAGPVVNDGSIVITNETCNNDNGSISGITATGIGLTYAWDNSTQTTLNLTNAGAGSYTLTVTDNQGCSTNSGPYTISANTPVSIDASAAVITHETCGQNNGSITGITTTGGSGTISYAWSNTTQTTANISNLDAGSYSLTVTDGDGCTANAGPFAVNNTPAPVINDANVVIVNESCTGGDGSITGITVSGTGLTYSWNNIPGTLDLTDQLAGTYTLEVTDGNNCTVTSGPYVIGGSTPMSIDLTNIAITASDCDVENGSISGITISGVNPTFTWTGGVTNPTSLTQTGLAAGTYILDATDAQGCTDTETIIVPSATGPVIDASSVNIVNASCGASNGSISGLVQTSIGTATYTWTGTNQTTLNLTGLPAGSYTLTATSAGGCTSQSGPFVIGGSGNPTADFSYLPSDVNPGDAVQFTDLSSSDVVAWDWSINGQDFTAENPALVFAAEGSYPVMLIVTNASGCTDTVTKTIEVYNEMTIPNVLTMNQDGLNDKFEIKGLESHTQVEIVNRWGNIVYKNSNYNNDWSGLDLNGEKLSDGVYTYYIRTAKGNYKQGFIHLID